MDAGHRILILRMKKKSKPLPFQNKFPVDVQIRLEANGASHRADIQAGMGPFREIPVDLTVTDLDDFSEDLQNALENVRVAFESDAEDDKKDASLHTLAAKGRFVFNKIFPEGLSRDLISNVMRQARIVQISSKKFFIPWELLYDGPTSHVDVHCFWGMKYIISRLITMSGMSGAYAGPYIDRARPRVHVVACRELDSVLKKELPELQRLSRAREIDLEILDPLVGADEQAIAKLRDFLCQSDVAHFACHAYQAKRPADSYLRFDNEYHLTIQEVENENVRVEDALVILNACRTGTVKPSCSCSWAEQFLRKGARGVLATELRIPDGFAAEFIKRVYVLMLKGNNLGASLLSARKDCWEEHRHVLGLAYALYASPLIQFNR